MRRFTGLLVIVLVLILLTTSIALAQDTEESKVVFCGDLSEADCKLLNEAESALWDATSGETAKSGTVYISGFPKLESADATVLFSNRSMFVAEQSTIDRMLALQEIDFEELAADQNTLVEALVLPLSIDTASSTQVTLSPELTALLSDTLKRDVPSEFIYETRQVGGIMYINLARFNDLVPESSMLGDWIGIDLMAFTPKITSDRLSKKDIDLAEIEKDVSEALIPPGKSTLAQPYLVKVEPGQEAMLNEFLEILPLRDASIDGQIAAVYRTKMDVPAYAGSSAFTKNLPGLTQTTEDALPEKTQERTAERDIAGTIMQGIGSAILSDSNATVVQGIGYDDAFLYGMEMHLSMEIAGKSLDISLQAANANINAVESVPVPEAAFVLPIRLIMGLIDTFKGGQ